MTEEISHLTLSEEQETFIKAALDLAAEENVLLIGKAGVGKSTAVWMLRKSCDEQNLPYICLAPTGVAAINIGGETIHRYINYLSSPYSKPKLPALILIDECSMLRADLFDELDKALRAAFMEPNVPFAGIRMILVGDPGQLPPVMRKNDGESEAVRYNYHTPYFFSAASYAARKWRVIELTTIFRVKEDKRFVNLLNMIREGKKEVPIGYLNQHQRTNVAKGVILVATNRSAAERNAKELAKLLGEATIFTAEVSGDIDKNEYPADYQLVLKVGARVMVIKNIYRGEKGSRYLELVNGDVGEITEINENCDGVPSDVVILCDRTGREHTIYKQDGSWEKTRAEFIEEKKRCVHNTVGVFLQLPLRLAWAITVHKSQGATLHELTLDLSQGGLFERGQAYVALSRGTALNRVWIMGKLSPSDIITCPDIAAFLEKYEAGVGIREGSIWDVNEIEPLCCPEKPKEELTVEKPGEVREAIIKEETDNILADDPFFRGMF